MARAAPIVLAVASIAAVAVAVFAPRATHLTPAGTALRVQVVDSATGERLPGARLSPSRLGERPALVRVTAPGYEARTVPLAPGQDAVVPLLKNSRDAVSLQFGGDVMMGRRFYERVDGRQPVLPRGAGVAAHTRVLQQIAPLLRDADVTTVNLESPLLKNPIVPPNGAGFLPGKDLVFASSTALAEALKRSGVEVAGLANNHFYDALEPGVKSTLTALDNAGIAHFGGGLDAAQAWQPAYVHVRGQTVAFVGCTTVTGYGTDPATDLGDATKADVGNTSYVAGPHKAGAAECQPGRLTRAVAHARQRADVVAVVIHGGVEYQRTQTAEVRNLAAVAAHAGATVVMGGHPHVVGGITLIGHVPWAETSGNLTFDQDLWDPSFSYLTRFDINGGSVVRTSVNPFVIDHYRPVPVVGSVADAMSRIAAGLIGGPLALGDGAAAAPRTPAALRHVDLSSRRYSVIGLPPGAVLPAGTEGGGTDLLYGTGSFERFTTGTESPGALWDLGEFATPSHDAACDGSYGLEVLRSPLSEEQATITPDHRQPVTAGTHLSLVAMVKAADPGATLELHWYKDFTGHSIGHTSLEIPTEGSFSGCHQVRLNATVPPGVVAVQPFIRLSPSGNAQERARLWIDDVRLVDWSVPADKPVLADVVDLHTRHLTLTIARSLVR